MLDSSELTNIWIVGMIAVALGCDAFSVALGIGAGKPFKGQTFRLGFHFGLFQALMPIIGWGIGSGAVRWVREWDHWLASGIVLLIAVHTLVEAMRSNRERPKIDFSRGWYLVTLSTATSIDALAVGLVFGVAEIAPWGPCLAIGLVAGGMTVSGLYIGRFLKASFGQIVEIAGGILLLIVAMKLSTI